ncbi:MAG TPA: GspH/FimT family pseudopilin [Steroidobacter sp.]|jgi:type IV fimbrial biogenesis protein FimT|nr:GspH/FimT family pseudopilin [Steroidobacteraceae bacterium]HLS79861.1 GspH/FimT family pseudopilin [Steroidobacter sp.]
MRNSRGITLIELLCTLLAVAVLISIAVPSLGGLTRSAQRTAAVNDFFHAVYVARSEAIKRGAVVSICKSPDGARCLNHGDWSEGWMVFVNSDRDEPPERDEGETLLAHYAGWPAGRITSNRLAYSFRAQTQGTVNGTVLFCDARGPEHSRAVIISHTGRPRVSRTDSSGRALPCAEG